MSKKRNVKKRLVTKPEAKQRQRSHGLMIPALLVLGTIVMAVVVVAMLHGLKSSSAQISSHQAPGPQKVSINRIKAGDAFLGQYLDPVKGFPSWITDPELTDASSKLMMTQFINPMMDEVLNRYPIASLRSKLRQAFSDPAVKRVFLFIGNLEAWPNGRPPLAMADADQYDPQKPAIQLVAQGFRSEACQLVGAFDAAQAKQSFEDALVMVYLHEYYHVTKQELWKKKQRSHAEHIASEADCWVYTCGLIAEMEKYGRGHFPADTPESQIIKFYHEHNRDTSGSDWVDLMERMDKESKE